MAPEKILAKLVIRGRLRKISTATGILIVSLAAAVAVFASISFVTKWGSTGSGDGQFFTPTGIAVDAQTRFISSCYARLQDA